MSKSGSLIPGERIERAILLIRGQKVMLDRDLASLYGVSTKALNQAVSRNLKRFPEDFMFRLEWDEVEQLSRSQFVTLKRGSNVKYRPLAFTEQGVAMLSSVQRSDRAVQVNVEIMRTFVRLREIISSHKDLARKLDNLNASSTRNSASSSTRFGNSRRRHPRPNGARSDFIKPPTTRFQELAIRCASGKVNRLIREGIAILG